MGIRRWVGSRCIGADGRGGVSALTRSLRIHNSERQGKARPFGRAHSRAGKERSRKLSRSGGPTSTSSAAPSMSGTPSAVAIGPSRSQKTERSKRTLLLPIDVIAALREQRVRQATERLPAGRKWADGDLVFTTPTGRPMDGVNVTHEFQAAIQRAGLPRQRYHDLRHAHATHLIEGGVELAVVSRALGHADLSTTADVYGAWTRDMAGRVASRMDDVLRRRASAS